MRKKGNDWSTITALIELSTWPLRSDALIMPDSPWTLHEQPRRRHERSVNIMSTHFLLVARRVRGPETSEPKRGATMVAVGGIFHGRSDAQKAAEALGLAGVNRDAIRFEVLPRSSSLVNVLGPFGIPEEAIHLYEHHVNPGDTLLVVTTNALPPEAIANEIARVGGLVVREGHYPAGFPGER